MNYEDETTAHLLELQQRTLDAYQCIGQKPTDSEDYNKIQAILNQRGAKDAQHKAAIDALLTRVQTQREARSQAGLKRSEPDA